MKDWKIKFTGERGIFLSVTLAVIAGFVIFKSNHLQVPFFWDEAYPYSYAVFHLLENGLSLSPTAIPVELSKGHPLLFHFLSASWIKLWGTSLISINLFPLLISVLTLLVTWKAGRKIFNKKTAFIAVTLTVVQAVFLAQSTFLLPEMLLSLFILLSLFYYLEEKHIPFLLYTTAALFTKESAIILPLSIGLFETVALIRHKKWSLYFKKILLIAIPVFFAALFFIAQKFSRGWFFYPTHLSLMELELESFLSQLEAFTAYLFIYYGRNIISLALLVALGVVLFKKRKLSKASALFLTFIGMFLLFSALNFFSPRYILCCIPLFAMVTASLSSRIIPDKPGWVILLTILLAAPSLYYSITRKTGVDHNLGYINAVETQESSIDFCLEKKWNNKIIYTGFLMYKYMSNPAPGYLEKEDVFTKVTTKNPEKAEIIILTSTEKNKKVKEMVMNSEKYERVFKKSQGNSVAQIYKLK